MRWGFVRHWPWWKDVLFLLGLALLTVALVLYFE